MLPRFLVTSAMAVLAGCTSAPQAPSTPVSALFDDGLFAARRVTPDPAAVFALTPGMRDYLVATVQPAVRLKGREGLIDALYSTQHLRLSYDGNFTRNASEAFDARAGNCLSLVIMTSAFARALGMDVRYQRLRADDVWMRDGTELVQLVGHVNLSLAESTHPALRARSPTSGWLTVDFLPLDDAQRERVLPIEERRVVAMYFNNKAAEALAGGQVDEAYWWARASIYHDPAYPSAYITLAVVYFRHAHAGRAEPVLRAALQLDPDNPQALHNLAAVLRTLGRDREAVVAALRLQAVQPHNPIKSFKAGLIAYQHGDYGGARDAFLTALRQAPEDHEFHFMLGMAYQRLGDRAKTAEHLQRAEALARTAAHANAYSAKLRLAMDAMSKQQPATR